MDPPYASGLAQMALDRVGNSGWVAPGGFLSIETDGEKLALPSGFDRRDRTPLRQSAHSPSPPRILTLS
jgi:16S rRNA G966 N2-methylase RsmD